MSKSSVTVGNPEALIGCAEDSRADCGAHYWYESNKRMKHMLPIGSRKFLVQNVKELEVPDVQQTSLC